MAVVERLVKTEFGEILLTYDDEQEIIVLIEEDG